MISFVHATDLHFEAKGDADVPKAKARIRCFIKDINNLRGDMLPSFVILSGDVSQRGAASEGELWEAKALYDDIRFPYYVIAGNHDLAPNRQCSAMYPGKEDYHEGPIYTSNFAKVFGEIGLRFSFQKEGFHFVGVSLRDGDPDGLLDWLEHEIAGTPKRKIVVIHYGLYPPRNAGPLLTWGFSRIGSVLPRLQSIVEDRKANVTAYLYGHNHVNSVVKKNGIFYVSSGGIQKGCTGYRLFKCYKDRIVSTFHFISDETLWDFNYWGEEEPEKCTDSEHGTVEDYHRGSKEERSFVIEYGGIDGRL
ncbi:MAG: hypothetical protein GXP33_04635 [Spirochaetes bacterium]|nr:hypothetical protein [Spirochaetota bacterium]